MDAVSWIALAGPVVAIGGAVVAIWKAAAARRAANEAQAQAQEARRHATAAEHRVAEVRASAAAADERVQLMRRELGAAEVERHEREGPDFQCRAEGRSGSTCPIVVTMASGPGEVTVRVAEQWVMPRTSRGPGDIRIESPVEDVEYRVLPQGSFTVQVDLAGYRDRVIVGLRLECTELGGHGRSWTRNRSVPVDWTSAAPRAS